MALLTLAETKSYLRIPVGTTDKDVALDAMIAATTEVVERHLKRAVEQGTRVDTRYDVRGPIWLNWPPVTEITSVVSVDGETTWDVEDLFFDADSGRLWWGSESEHFWGNIVVTYEAGSETIPPNVKQAAMVIVAHMWESQSPGRAVDARFGTASTDQPVPPSMYSDIPARAKRLLGSAPPLVG